MAVFTRRLYPVAEGNWDGSPYSGSWSDGEAVCEPGPSYASTPEISPAGHAYHRFVLRSRIPRDAVVTGLRWGLDAQGEAGDHPDMRVTLYEISGPAVDGWHRMDTPSQVLPGERAIVVTTASAARLATLNGHPGLLRECSITVRASYPAGAPGVGIYRVYRLWLEVTYESDSSDEVDIYPDHVGLFGEPAVDQWADSENALNPDGGATYATATMPIGSAGRATWFTFQSDIPTGATLDTTTWNATAAGIPDQNPTVSLYIYNSQFPSAPNNLLAGHSLSFAGPTFETQSRSSSASVVQALNDYPGVLRSFALQLRSGHRGAGQTDTEETLLIDSFFLRVRYTYEPGELAATFETSPDLQAALRLAGYLSVDFATQAELAAMLAPVVRELQARFEVTAHLDADLRRAALLEALFQVAPHLEADVRKVLDPIHGPQLRLQPAGARLQLMPFAIKAGDLAEPLTGQCLDVHGEPIDLADRTVTVIVSPRPGAEPIVERQAVVTDAAQGRWRLDWRAGDTDRPGTYRVDVVLTDVNGDRQTVPGAGHGIITIGRGLA